MSAEARLKELGLELPVPPKPMAVYKSVVVVGNIAYVSGHGPMRHDKSFIIGRVGDELTEEQGKEAARFTGLGILATLRNHLGSLDRVVRVVKLLGMVYATPEFENQPEVINGCSELFKEVFGDAGVGARSAVGMGSLPGRIAVEIEGIFEIQP